jgi:WS/DGAT/MGAT family acyltransferase
MSSLLAEGGSIHVNVGGTVIVDGEPAPFDDLLEHVEARLNLVPRFRQRVTRVPLGLDNPEWGDDPRFDIRWHVQRLALPRPGSMTELRDLVGEIFSQPLDFTRPLWRLYLIEGLEPGRHAIVSKTHHALVDGVSALDVGTLLVDPNPEGTEMELPAKAWEPDEPSPEMLFVRAASERIRSPVRAARKAALSALVMPRDTASRLRRTAEGFTGLAAGGPAVPATFLNREIGRDRRVAFVSTRLDLVKAARGDGPATVNDVVLAAAAGALGRFFERRGEELPEHLVALVPVSTRRPDEELELGNRITTIFIALPIRERDPAARLRAIHEQTARLKDSEQARAASLVIEATGFAPPTINRILAGALSGPLTWNLVVSNVPGPQFPLYVLGRRIEAIHPFVPLSPQRRALSIGLLSYDGGVFFGLTGDRDLLADIDDLAADVEAALAEQLG